MTFFSKIMFFFVFFKSPISFFDSSDGLFFTHLIIISLFAFRLDRRGAAVAVI